VLIGCGVRLVEYLGTEPIELEQLSAVEGTGVTHLRYRVVKETVSRLIANSIISTITHNQL
jgi:hypothetical protein